jgi:hypothetical protein
LETVKNRLPEAKNDRKRAEKTEYIRSTVAKTSVFTSTGRETPRGNSGDIGKTKVRQRRKWFSRKYYASVMNIKEFYEDNIGRSFTGILMKLGHDYVK